MGKFGALLNEVAAKAIELDLSVSQVENATRAQVESFLGKQLEYDTDQLGVHFTVQHLAHLKEHVVRAIRRNNRIKIKNVILARLNIGGNWVQDNYPDAELSQEVIKGKLAIQIWPYGKPVVDIPEVP